MSLFPIFLKLTNVQCLVIGGGRVAERKVKNLIDAKAEVTVIAPSLTSELENLVKQNKINYKNREYKQGELKEYFMVIASTDSKKVNKMIYKEVVENNSLINCVDKPEQCNFFVPSSLKRGDLQIAISTTGKVPYFAKKLRQFLEKIFYKELKTEIEELHNLRKKIIKDAKNDNAKKARDFEEILKPKIDKILEKIEIK